MPTMDSRIGLDYIVENPEYIRKLAAALDTPNITVKKQVFELLSALCVHNEEGRARALDTLEDYKNLKGERYRLNLVVKELDRATAVDYQTALVAFTNCLIISAPRLNDRARLRNEFIGCHLLPVLNNLRKCAEAEPELAVQLDVFDEQRESDDAQSLQGPHGVDLNSPLDVFYAILKQVVETPQEIPFLNILHHLLRIDPKEAVSDIIWDTSERLVHRATLLENREDAARLLRSPSVQNKLFCQCQQRSEASLVRKPSLSSIPLSPPPGPPPPPPLGPSFPPPPPPPPNIPAPPIQPPSAPIPPPLSKSSTLKVPSIETDSVIEKLPQQEIPAPKIKMKTINWNKIPSNRVVGKNNIWSQVAYCHQQSPMADMDWVEMEGLFCQQAPPSPRLGNREPSSSEPVERRMRKDNSEIALLDGKRSLNVNIFLKQFRSTNEEIILLIREGEHEDIGAEKLKGLLKILPEVDELDMLKSFNGDFHKLGNAEKFLVQLTNLSNYKLRIESMLLKEEFAANMSYLQPSINSMILAAQDLMTNKPLKEVLYMILVAGNFLNSGGYAGDAAGVKLTSLQKITDIRANKPNMNLIHFVALQAEKRDKSLLSFTSNTSLLEDAAKTTVEQLHNEINALDVRIKKIKKQIDTTSTEIEIKHQMSEFLHVAETEVANLQLGMIELETVRRQLSEFFCEDLNSFKLEECFRIFHGFYCKFKQAIGDNERRRIQEEQATARRKQREELLATKRRQMELAGTGDSEGPFIDLQLYEPKGFSVKKGRKPNGNSEDDQSSLAGSPLPRRRVGSFNGNGDTPCVGKEERSPDITPNGSLRRRRSRVLSEEDEGNLMDFLRASGPDNTNRERKSWGSLDRSWARKVRGSGPRKRPALLAADFSSDRERPSSPSPLTEHKPIVSSAPEDETKPKEWRQKIESWLQANESDQVSEETRRQVRRVANRKSLELDSESDRSNTLDTLPEGKQVYSGSQSTYRKVYQAWKPSTAIDKTDIVGAIEAVEDAQPQPKDKSAWRKSTLNVANSTEETSGENDSNRFGAKVPDTFQPLHDDHTRKSLISSLGEKKASDKLTLYIRQTSDPSDEKILHHNNAGRRRDSQSSVDQSVNNKVEIDQDNIETPPATRKIFIPSPVDKREPVQPTPCKRMLNRAKESEDGDLNATLGDGQFDRYSAARRTRRYKRSTDKEETTSPTELVAEVHKVRYTPPLVETSQPILLDVDADKEDRLKQWQGKLHKSQDNDSQSTKRYRHLTEINQNDVKKALEGIQPIQIKLDSESTYLNVDKRQKPSNKIDIPSRKNREHDNDEGFEETQSLMSESPSQGASSGGNYENEVVDTANFVITDFRENGVSNSEQSDTKKKNGMSNVSTRMIIPNQKTSSRVTSHIVPKTTRNLDRSLSVRQQLQDLNRRVLPKRSTSLRKTDSQQSNIALKKNIIQKSNSRNSIVSSRSSLNSATSTNTVKKAPIKSSSILSPNSKSVVSKTSSIKSNVINKVPLRRTPSTSSTSSKPPRPQGLSFMKPTAASATKVNVLPTKSTQFRSKS